MHDESRKRDAGELVARAALGANMTVPEQPDSADLEYLTHVNRLVEPFRRFVRPVLEVKDGSKKNVVVGTAFILAHEGDRYIVTADHTVDGPTSKRVSTGEKALLAWPRDSSVVRSGSDAVPDPDIAIAWAPASSSESLREGISALHDVAPAWVLQPNALLIAVGFPAAMAKRGKSYDIFKAATMTAIVRHQPPTTYLAHNIDPSQHLAARFEREVVTQEGRVVRTLPHPKGLSGGVLLGLKTIRGVQRAFLAGVLVRYEESVLIASRIDPVLQGIFSPGSMNGAKNVYRPVPPHARALQGLVISALWENASIDRAIEQVMREAPELSRARVEQQVDSLLAGTPDPQTVAGTLQRKFRAETLSRRKAT